MYETCIWFPKKLISNPGVRHPEIIPTSLTVGIYTGFLFDPFIPLSNLNYSFEFLLPNLAEFWKFQVFVINYKCFGQQFAVKSAHSW